MNLYELYRQLNKYEAMLGNLNRAYNILSKVEIQDNLSAASHSLKSNYLVNDTAYKERYISKSKATISSCTSSLQRLISYTSNAILKIKRQINSLEEDRSI